MLKNPIVLVAILFGITIIALYIFTVCHFHFC